jgi:hypothetical protein
MNKLFLSLLIVSQYAIADCDIRSASQNQTEYQVGKITNLVKDKSKPNICQVSYDLTVDGELHSLSGSRGGLGSQEMLCIQAIEETKMELLATLGGKFRTESVTVCAEGSGKPKKVSIGDSILENEVGRSKVDKYFKHKGTKCRMFEERYAQDRHLRVYYGVICQTDDSGTNWIVVDKW